MSEELHQSGIRFSEADIAFQKQWREWLDRTLPPEWGGSTPQEWHDNADRAEVGRAWRRKLCEETWAAIAWPRERGGREATVLQQVLFKAELILRGVPHPFIRIATNEDNGGRAATAVMEYGTPDQQESFIPRILSGEITFCQGFSEPDAGSDLAGLKTRAALDGDWFTVNGQKIWTGDAHLADWMYMLVRTDLDAPKYRGISYLLVEMNSDGVEVRGIRDITGGQRVNEVFFDDVRVPRTNLVGEINQGWAIARSTLQVERSGLFNTNLLDNMLGSVVRLAEKTVRPDGRTAWQDDEFRRKIARQAIIVNCVKQLGYTILVQQMRERPLGAEPSVGKLAGSELRQDLTETSLDILGRYGLLGAKDELAVNKGMAGYAYIIERGATIGGGTSEMQRNAIAEKGLGLPKD